MRRSRPISNQHPFNAKDLRHRPRHVCGDLRGQITGVDIQFQTGFRRVLYLAEEAGGCQAALGKKLQDATHQAGVRLCGYGETGHDASVR